MIIGSGLGRSLWAEAVHHSVWIGARVPSRASAEFVPPIEKATGKKPNLNGVLEWGARVWVKDLQAGKLDPRAKEGRFVGYDDESKGYRIYWPSKNKVSVERNVYADKNAVLSPGVVTFEGEWEAVENQPEVSKPNAPKESDEPLITQQQGHAPKENVITPDNNNEPSTLTDSDPIDKTRRNSLTGLPQYDQSKYGRGKRRANTGSANVVECEDESLEPGGVEWEPSDTDANWFIEALHMALAAISDDEPEAEEAIKGSESDDWKLGMEEELTQIERLDTWELVIPPPDANIVPSKWTLHRKRNAQGEITRYRARVVAKGYVQIFGRDYKDTFAPTVRSATLRILLSLAASNEYEIVIEQADVKNAYLNALLDDDEVIYLALPPFYKLFRTIPTKLDESNQRVALCLRRPLYGTKQGAHHWYQELKRILTSLGFIVSQADEATFYRVEGDKFVIMAVATDDFTIIADSAESSKRVKTEMGDFFQLVDLGPINWLLGVSVTRDLQKRTISLSQETYINQVVTRFGLEDAKATSTPMEPSVDLTPDSPSVSPKLLTPHEKTTYREMIGSLMYLSTMTRPDITYAVSTLSQYLESPHTTHLEAVKRVFRYLIGTKQLKLVLGGDCLSTTSNSNGIIGFSDADWASQLHRHSISGFAFFVGIGAVSWSAKKQPIVTLSSTESEYVALTHATKDILWIHKLLSELSFLYKHQTPTILHCDNQGAIELSKNSRFHARTKHIDVHFHFVRQTVDQGHIQIKYIPTEDMVADMFTKSLARTKFETFRKLLNVI
jgi:hypothetical protein